MESSLNLLGNNNVLVDQNVAGYIIGREESSLYIRNLTSQLDQLFPASRTWVISPFALLQFVGLSNKKLPLPPPIQMNRAMTLEEQIKRLFDMAKPFFEQVIDDRMPLIREKVGAVAVRSKLAEELLESRKFFLQTSDNCVEMFGRCLAFDYIQNLDLYMNVRDDHVSFLCTITKWFMEGVDIPLFRLIMSQRFVRLYQRMMEASNAPPQIKNELPFMSKELPGLKTGGDRLDCDIVHQLIVGIRETLIDKPVTVVTQDDPLKIEQRLKYSTGIYQAAMKRIRNEFPNLMERKKYGRLVGLNPETGLICYDELVQNIGKLSCVEAPAN